LQRRAAVLGSPVSHSLSPVLHRAAYAALNLPYWRYDAIECDDVALPAFVGSLGLEWAGLSVTMPGKRAALDLADAVTPTALAVGAANTLVHGPDGEWLADSTDVDGVLGSLAAYGVSAAASAVVLGAGGTAAAAIVALSRLGVSSLIVVARSALRATDAVACAARVGLRVQVAPWSELPSLSADVLVSTVPAGVVDDGVATVVAAGFPAVLDAVYHPWPTPLARAVSAQGGALVTGLDMLLHQAFGQVETFTRRPAPREAMRAALRSAVGSGCPPLPL
jgi:shikimate-5-dehydrogenase